MSNLHLKKNRKPDIYHKKHASQTFGNVNNILNQTTGYEGSEKNVEPLIHLVQPAGALMLIRWWQLEKERNNQIK